MRLSISLAAVAVLGAAANMIAQKSAAVIRISIPTPEIQAPPPIPLPRPTDQPSGIAALAVHASAPSAAAVDAARLQVERFERASHLRADINSAANEAEFLAAADALRLAPLDFAGSSLAKLAAEYRARGKSLIHAAESRRAARAEHSRHLGFRSSRGCAAPSKIANSNSQAIRRTASGTDAREPAAAPRGPLPVPVRGSVGR